MDGASERERERERERDIETTPCVTALHHVCQLLHHNASAYEALKLSEPLESLKRGSCEHRHRLRESARTRERGRDTERAMRERQSDRVIDGASERARERARDREPSEITATTPCVTALQHKLTSSSIS
jgi:hypothetical protein